MFKIILRILNVLILSVFCVPLNLYSNENNDSFERMFTDFNGLCHNDKIVLAYGNNGIILFSTDKGINWFQDKIVSDTLNIRKIINIRDNFYGICDKEKFIKSDANAVEWEIKNHAGQYIFSDLISDGNYLYVLTQQKTIEIFDLDFNKIRSIKIDTSFAPLTICYFKNKLLLPNNKEPNILSIAVNDNDKQKIIEVGDYGKWVKDLKVDKDRLYANIDKALFATDSLIQNWEKLSYKIHKYIVKDGQIYDLRVNTNLKYKVSWIDFYRIVDKQNRVKINLDSIDRYVINPVIKEYEFIDDNTIVAVGYMKTIYISTNKGKTWKLKSNINNIDNIMMRPLYVKWLNEKVGFFANGGQIFKTKNGGATWLPQKFTDTLIKKIRYLDAFYIDSTGKGFAFSTDNSEIWEDSTKNRNFIYTLDYGETYNGSFQSRVVGLTARTGIKIIKTNSNYLVYTALIINPMTYFLQFDFDFNLKSRYWLDSIYIRDMKYSDNKLIAIANDGRGEYSSFYRDSSNVIILRSADLGKKWTEDKNFKLSGTFPVVEIWNTEGAFLTTEIRNAKEKSFYTRFYSIDLKGDKANEIFIDTSFSGRFLMYFMGKIYIINHDRQYFSTDNYFVDFPKFNLENFNLPLKNFVVNWSNDTIIYAKNVINKNSFYQVNLFKFKPNRETSVNQRREISQFFFSTPPIPTPAKDIVRFTFYWDQGVDVSKAKIKVYNLFGDEITNNSDITIIPKKSYSEEIIWNCSSAPNGIYFVNIGYGNFSKSIPIIVVK